MPLIECKECAKEISDKADKCPHCGAPIKQAIGCFSGLLFIFLLAILVGIIGQGISLPVHEPAPTADPKVTTLGAAKGACMLALKGTLNDPDSADFSTIEEWFTDRRADGTILVQPRIRAKNPFGAYILATWECVIKGKNGTISILKLKQISP